MTEEKLKELMGRLWHETETVRGDDMVDIYTVESTIREMFNLYGSDSETTD